MKEVMKEPYGMLHYYNKNFFSPLQIFLSFGKVLNVTIKRG